MCLLSSKVISVTMPKMSIIIPHKPTVSNDKALMLALRSILDCTVYDYELFIDTTVPGDPYTIWNKLSHRASGEILIFSNSDVIFAHEWDKLLVENCVPNVIVTGYMVEPGNIGVAPVNISRDFGKHPDSFDRITFEAFVSGHNAPEVKEERAWYMPCAMDRAWFVSTGGFPTDIGFPEPNDIKFWNRCKAEYGTRFLRVRSYSYHFQAQSTRE